MIYLTSTTDKLQVLVSTGALVDVQANYVDGAASTLVTSGAGRQNTSFNSGASATQDVVASPGASTTRTLKQLTARNKDNTLSGDVSLLYNANGTVTEIDKVTLAPGDSLIYIEGIGLFTRTSAYSPITASANTADVVATGADTYLSGSALNLSGMIQAGSHFRWRFIMTKTAAGVATPIFSVRFGTAGSVADTAQLVFTLGAQTAAVDTGYAELDVMIRNYGASGVVQGTLEFQHKNTTTGLASVAQVQILTALSAAFDLTPSGLLMGVSCNPGASGVWTFQEVSVVGAGLKVR